MIYIQAAVKLRWDQDHKFWGTFSALFQWQVFFCNCIKTSQHITTKQFFTDNMGRNTNMFFNGITDSGNSQARGVWEYLWKLVCRVEETFSPSPSCFLLAGTAHCTLPVLPWNCKTWSWLEPQAWWSGVWKSSWSACVPSDPRPTTDASSSASPSSRHAALFANSNLDQTLHLCSTAIVSVCPH